MDEQSVRINHIASPYFGAGISPFKEGTELYDILMNHSVPDALSAQLVLNEAYDIDYGIFDHDNPSAEDSVMAVIGMHGAETVWGDSKLYSLMDELVACRIPELTNTSLQDLLNWPRHHLDRMIKRYKPGAKKEAETVKEIEEAIAESKRQQQQQTQK